MLKKLKLYSEEDYEVVPKMVEYSGKIVNNTKIKHVKQIVLNIYLIKQAYEADLKGNKISDNKLLNKKNKEWE